MKQLIYSLIFALFLPIVAYGQTATPTLAMMGTAGHTNWSAYHEGSFRFDPGSLDAIESDELIVIIPGIQLGDSIIIYPATVCADGVTDGSTTTCFERGLAYTGVRIIGNNQIAVRYSNLTASAVDATAGDWNYLWFDRTNKRHASTPMPTVTPTP